MVYFTLITSFDSKTYMFDYNSNAAIQQKHPEKMRADRPSVLRRNLGTGNYHQTENVELQKPTNSAKGHKLVILREKNSANF